MSSVRRGAAAVALSVAVACGQPAPTRPAPVASATPSAAAAPTATPAAPSLAATAAPTPRPSPLSSSSGAILVRDPLPGDHVASPLGISGDASVFEGTVAWRLVTATGRVLAEGSTQATVGAPQKGTFGAQVSFGMPYYRESGFLEIFERSPKDGTIAQIVRVPVEIDGAY